MGAFIDELKHAFALGPAPGEPAAMPEALERFAASVVERGLEVPALLLLETVRPLSFLAGQGLFAVSPLLKTVVGAEDWEALAAALEDRRTVMALISHIETLAHERGVVR
jgi:hypothetical protein